MKTVPHLSLNRRGSQLSSAQIIVISRALAPIRAQSTLQA